MLDCLKIFTLFFLFAISIPIEIQAQSESFDQLASKAQYHTNEDIDYPKAKQFAKSALKLQPDNQSLKTLLARIYLLSKQYDLSEQTYQSLIESDSSNYDLHIQLLNLYELQEKYPNGFRWIEKSLQRFPNDENLLFRKAYNLDQQGQQELAYKISKDLLAINPEHEKAKYIHDKLYPKFVDNFVQVAFSSYYSQSTEASTLNFYNIQYGRRIKSSTLIGMITWLESDDSNGLQYSAELYSKLNKHTSSYLNVSLSPSELFPYLRLNGDIYRGFQKGYEGSFRINMLFLDEKNVQVLSPGIGKYYKNLYLLFNINFIRSDSESEVTYNFRVRRYFSNPQNYVGVSIGSIPSDDIIGFRPDTNLTASFISVEGKMKLSLRTSVGVSFLKNISTSMQSRDLISVFARQDF